MELLDIHQLLIRSYHAACEGAAKRALKTFLNIISLYTSTNQKNCDVIVNYASLVINTSRSETTGYSPFELVYGRPPIQPVDMALNFEGFEEKTDATEYATCQEVA